MLAKHLKQGISLLLLFASLCFLPGCSDNEIPALPTATATVTEENTPPPEPSPPVSTPMVEEMLGVTSLTSSRYDIWFRKSTRLHMFGVDWRLLKSQCYAESRFDARAVSPVGAKGACQFMPGTWKDVEEGRKIWGDPFDAQLNIDFAGYYMAKLRRGWSAPRPDKDRHSLAMASYNAGFGHLLNAQKRCGDKSSYSDIIACLPQITGDHSNETITYVDRIWRFYFKLKVL